MVCDLPTGYRPASVESDQQGDGFAGVRRDRRDIGCSQYITKQLAVAVHGSGKRITLELTNPVGAREILLCKFGDR